MVRQRLRVVLFAGGLALVGIIDPVRAEIRTPLFEIPVDQLPAGANPSGSNASWRVVLESPDPVALAGALSGHVTRLGPDGRLEVVVGQYVVAASAMQRDWRAATFVIDYEDAPVPDLVSQLRAATAEPTPADVVRLVSATVRGSHERGFDVASQVARNRQGDCTEYAVLTAALARASGLPARVVLGVALTTNGDRFGAYGHAWAEIDAGAGWQVADAALPAMGASVRYLPLGVLEDEGPGYMMSVVRLMPKWIRRVSMIAVE
jgi:hypothetical protein